MALVGEACAGCDFSQAGSPFANQLDRALQSEMHDPAVRGDANRSGEHVREVGGTPARYTRERGDLDGLIEMGNDIVSEPPEHVFAQHASCLAGDP